MQHKSPLPLQQGKTKTQPKPASPYFISFPTPNSHFHTTGQLSCRYTLHITYPFCQNGTVQQPIPLPVATKTKDRLLKSGSSGAWSGNKDLKFKKWESLKCILLLLIAQ